MKCITSFIFLTLLSISSVLCRYQTGTATVGYLKYRLYNDGKATVYDTTSSYISNLTIPAKITYSGKSYLVSEIAANTFTSKEVTKITVDGNNTGLLIRENAFYEIRVLKEFNMNSMFVDVEIGGFRSVGNYVQFQGIGSQYAADKYVEKLLKKWNLPIRKSYANDEWVKMQDLFTLGKVFQRNFGNYDKVAVPDNAINVLFIGAGSTNGLARLYRLFANTMGVYTNEIMVGCDNIHICWNYVLVNKNQGKKWHVFDVMDKIGDNTTWNLSAFKEEYRYLPTLKKFYGSSYNLDPHTFVVHTKKYNYPNESQSFYPDVMNFDEWLRYNPGYPRTLN